jgi:hypothetical protein
MESITDWAFSWPISVGRGDMLAMFEKVEVEWQGKSR